jgi:hypothetical protein
VFAEQSGKSGRAILLQRRSSRPHRVSWPSALVRAVELPRQDYPMWGRAKLGPIVRAEGFAVSDATVGRIPSGAWWRAAWSTLKFR